MRCAIAANDGPCALLFNPVRVQSLSKALSARRALKFTPSISGSTDRTSALSYLALKAARPLPACSRRFRAHGRHSWSWRQNRIADVSPATDHGRIQQSHRKRPSQSWHTVSKPLNFETICGISFATGQIFQVLTSQDRLLLQLQVHHRLPRNASHLLRPE